MSRDVTCADCGVIRRNATYANTKYCKSDRLLRDLMYLGERTKRCGHCKKDFAPTDRRDPYCGFCNFGSIYTGDCAFCKRSDAELHRDGIPVCVKCVRDPKLRRTIIAGLKNGQKDRRAASGWTAP